MKKLFLLFVGFLNVFIANQAFAQYNKEDIFTLLLEKHELEESRKKFPFLMDADQFLINPKSGADS